jgi:hypothetical protein
VASELALLNTEQELCNMKYTDGQDFIEHIAKIRTRWSNATALSANIDNKSFRMIILQSLPQFWDSIVSTLYTTQTSHEAISHLMTHWARINRDHVLNPLSNTSALQALSNNRSCDRLCNQNSQLVCVNPNCNRHGHMIENCYWPGGGKAGQFPPGFGKRGGARGTVNNTSTGQSTSANSVSETTEQVFALLALIEISSEVQSINDPPSTPPSNTSLPNPRLPETIGVKDTTEVDHISLSSFAVESNSASLTSTIITLLDSGASDHCFVKRKLFSQYQPISPP